MSGAKIAVAAAWLLGLLAVVAGGDSTLAWLGRGLFWFRHPAQWRDAS
jgi:hypothetical protein